MGRKGLFLGLALAAALAIPPALAQVGPPVRLGPPPAPPPPQTIQPGGSFGTPAPLGANPLGRDTSPPNMPVGGSLPTTPPSKNDDIRSDTLAPLDDSWAGSLSTADRALPATLWEGTPRPLVAAALPLLSPNTSPTLQDLAARLLLSGAESPAGRDPEAGPRLATLRLQRLLALGHVAQATAIVEAMPNPPEDEDFDRMRVELRFLANDVEGGCQQTGELIGRYPGPWWDRAQIACQALHKDTDKAQLGLSLLREKKVPRDLVFDALVEATIGARSGKLEKLPEPTPILLSLLAAAKQPLPADALAAASPALLREWATNPAVPAGDRLAAGERAAALGSLTVDELREIYDRLDFKPEERAAALSQTEQAGPRARALLYEAARTQTVAPAQAEALKALLAEGRKRNDFLMAARLAAPMIQALQPTNDLSWFAPDAARALYAAGKIAEARAWTRLGEAEGGASLWIVSRLAQGQNGTVWQAGLLREAAQPAQGMEATVQLRRAQMALTLLSAFDEPIEPETIAPLLAAPPTPGSPLPNAVVWLDQGQAAGKKRLGETVLLTLVIARTGDRLTPDAIPLLRAISGLRAAGLEIEARALAVEAAIAAGI